MNKTTAEDAFREYLSVSKSEETDRELVVIFLAYLSHLYEEIPEETSLEGKPEEILIEDVSQFEIDDFISFFIPDNFEEETEEMQADSYRFLKEFSKFALKKKLMDKEQVADWNQVLEENDTV